MTDTQPIAMVPLAELVRRGLVLRGTKEWDKQELDRMRAGRACLSFGEISGANDPHEVTRRVKAAAYRIFVK